VAVQGNPGMGFLLLFSFAWGMGLLLLVVGTSAGALKRLPRSGEWLLDVKRLFGFIFLAVAVYFVRTLVPEMVYLLAIAACLIAGGIAFGALDSIPTPTTGQRMKRGIAVLLMVLGFYVLLGTLWNRGVFLSERSEAPVAQGGQAPTAAAPELEWGSEVYSAFEQARKEKRRVLIDWTADWCEICKEMEKEAFTRADVAKAMSEYVLLRVDVTDLDKREENLAAKHKFLAPPTLIVADGDGKSVAKMEGYESPGALLTFLQGAKTKAPAKPTGEEPAPAAGGT